MKKLRILVACEYSGTVRDNLLRLGHYAASCDLVPSDSPLGDHFQCDVFDIIDHEWDMLIGFPPCTHLAVSGAKHFAKKRADGRQQQGIDFFMRLAEAPIKHIALENPVGIMSSVWRKPDQIIQPWQFGDTYQKTTCLWLKNLPPLKHTSIVDKGEFYVAPSGKKMPKWFADNKSAKVRSTTFPGIGKAMAEQWSDYVSSEKPQEGA